MKNIRVESMSFSYGSTTILDNLSMDIAAGGFVCILGQSGCGKSTFLRLIAGLSHPSSGSIYVGDEKLEAPSLSRGVVFQDYSLFPWFTTGKNIIISLKQKFKDKSKKELKEIAMFYLKEVGLDESVFYKYPYELSGGMRQRCAICRSFALDPPVLLMDEPFGALDAVTRARLQDMTLELWKKGAAKKEERKTVLFVTHDVDEALLLSTSLYVLGSSPSNVIYSHSFDSDKEFNRKSLFENEGMITLRNKLIHVINSDVESHITK